MADCAERCFAAENFFACEAEILFPVVCHALVFLIERLHARLCDAHQPLVFGGRQFHEEVMNRVYAHAVVAHLVVEVGRQREARVARDAMMSPRRTCWPLRTLIFERWLYEVS